MSQIIKRVIVYVLYFLIVVVIVGAIVIALTSSDKTEAPSEEQGTNHDQSSDHGTQANGTAAGNNVSVSNQPANGSSINRAGSASNSSQAASTQNSGTELSNSGPGETVAVFMAGTAIGYALYRRKLVKQEP